MLKLIKSVRLNWCHCWQRNLYIEEGNKYVIQMIKYALGIGDVEKALQRWIDGWIHACTHARMKWRLLLFNTYVLHMGLVVIKYFPLEDLATYANILHSQCPWATLHCFYYHVLWDSFRCFFLNNLNQKCSEFSDNWPIKIYCFIQLKFCVDSQRAKVWR